ncbi:MAG: hypothetical protein J2P21_32080, partial [Chloracidobacterium sp.]|nr:hypothetical protein [Chloracidobacterium sp.]
MRRLTIVALSTLILLRSPFSTPQASSHSIGRTSLMIDLLHFPVAGILWPGAMPAQPPFSEGGVAPSDQEGISLEPGKPIERELSGGQSHSYIIPMNSGEYLHIVVEQRGIDVAVALFA